FFSKEIVMHSLRARILLAILGLTLITMPSIGHAAQIAPNPNTGTIDIINGPTAFNNFNPFSNGGTINIDSSSTLTNMAGAGLVNEISPPIPGTASSVGTVNNAGTLNNYGGI